MEWNRFLEAYTILNKTWIWMLVSALRWFRQFKSVTKLAEYTSATSSSLNVGQLIQLIVETMAICKS